MVGTSGRVVEINILIALTGVFGFYMAWNIGANDVANAMGTSVGSKALSYRNAIIVAAIFEFLGAMLIGGHNTATIQSRILDVSAFQGKEIDLILGMMAAMLASGIFNHFATARGWPVSTTHAIIGSLAGFGLTVGGFGVVKWSSLSPIVMNWFISPLAGGIMAALIFTLILYGIIRRRDPQQAMVQIVPILVFMYLLVIVLEIFFKGLEVINIHPNAAELCTLAIVIPLTGAILARILVRRIVKKHHHGHSRRRIERVFSVLQVMTACYMAFAHGASDVGSAIAPVSSVLITLRHGVTSVGEQVSPWVLALGAVGIIAGLATFGAKCMATVGKAITGVVPTRGFAAEFGAATVVLLSAKLGLPLSTSHVIVGAVVGIGLMRGFQAVNMKLVREVLIGWVITVPISALIAIALYWLMKWIWIAFVV